MPLTCPVCQQPGEVVLRGPREATVGTVAVQLERAPVIGCRDDHGAVPPEAIGAAMAATDAAIVRARGRLFRADACGRCGAALTMPARRTQRAVTVEGDHAIPVLTLRFDLPAARCPQCGTDQLPTRSQEDLVVSVPAVFAAGTAAG